MKFLPPPRAGAQQGQDRPGRAEPRPRAGGLGTARPLRISAAAGTGRTHSTRGCRAGLPARLLPELPPAGGRGEGRAEGAATGGRKSGRCPFGRCKAADVRAEASWPPSPRRRHRLGRRLPPGRSLPRPGRAAGEGGRERGGCSSITMATVTSSHPGSNWRKPRGPSRSPRANRACALPALAPAAARSARIGCFGAGGRSRTRRPGCDWPRGRGLSSG